MVAEVAGTRRPLDDAGGLQFFGRIAVLLRPLEDVRDAVRRVADEIVRLNLLAEIALLQVLARKLALLRLLETTAVELRDFGEEREDPLALAGGRVLLLLDLHAALFGQLLDGLDEGEAVHLLDELDGVPRLAATEAVVIAAVLVDVERGRLLVMERTARLLRHTCRLHLNAIRGNQVRQINARLDFLNGRLCYPLCHRFSILAKFS